MRAALHFFVALLLTAGATHRLNAQRVTGRVLEEPTGMRIGFVELVLIDPDGSIATSAVSDSAGFFLLQNDPGMFRIRATRLGYASFLSEPIELKPNETVSVLVRLAAEGIRLPPLQVNARTGDELGRDGFDRRRALGKGVFLTSDSIRVRRPYTTSDLFDGIPSVMVHEGFGATQVYSMRGGKCFFVYRDHMPRGELAGVMPDLRHAPPRGGGSENPLNNVKVEWIRGIEIYRDMSEVPRELRTSNRMFDILPPGGIISGGRLQSQACGVIWIWTEIGW